MAPASDIQLMKQEAQNLGIDTSRLLPVQQKGCKYEGADPAPAGYKSAGSGSGQQAPSTKANMQSG